MLVRGEVALPYSPELEAELLTCSSFTNSRGLLQVVDKEAWKKLLGGRSPDRLDAVVIAVAADGSVSFDIDPALESAVSL